ncbi:MAG: phosphoribosyltransferase [Candidatus Aminicenantes bacterium]|nr:phosphoribosyltransferase [Candidatus Aminicenantes bacterium]
MFKNRKDAGNNLAFALDFYKGKNVLVLAIPRGGVEVGYQVAKHLGTDFSILISRKLPYPDNPEAGFGAVAEDGSTILLEDASLWIPDEEIKEIISHQIHEIRRRIKVLRKGKPLPEITGRTVILVDDGLAMGSTMRAAIELCRKKKAKKIVVAVPVAGGRIARELDKIVDETVILEVPRFFQAVAQVYLNWYDVSDEKVLNILEKWEKQQHHSKG